MEISDMITKITPVARRIIDPYVNIQIDISNEIREPASNINIINLRLNEEEAKALIDNIRDALSLLNIGR